MLSYITDNNVVEIGFLVIGAIAFIGLCMHLRRKQEMKPPFWRAIFAAGFIFLFAMLLSSAVHGLIYPKTNPAVYMANIEQARMVSLIPTVPAAKLDKERLKERIDRLRLSKMESNRWYTDSFNLDNPDEIRERFPYQLTGARPSWGSGLKAALYIEENGLGLLVATPEATYYYQSAEPLIELGEARESVARMQVLDGAVSPAPLSFPPPGELKERLNKAFSEAKVKEVRAPIALNEQHVYVPHISVNGYYGYSFWVREKASWEIRRIDTSGYPTVWKLRGDDPSGYYLVWNIDPESAVAHTFFFLTRYSDFHIRNNVHAYRPRIALRAQVDLAAHPAGAMQLPENWQTVLREDQRGKLFLAPQFSWIAYDEGGKLAWPKSSSSTAGYSRGRSDLEFVRVADENQVRWMFVKADGFEPVVQPETGTPPSPVAVQSVDLIYTKVESPATSGSIVNLADVYETKRLGHGLIAYSHELLSDEPSELFLGWINGNAIEEWGSFSWSHYADRIEIEEVEAFGRKLLHVRGLCGASCANSYLLTEKEGKPEIVLHAGEILHFGDLNGDGIGEVIGTAGSTVVEVHIYKEIDGILQKANVNEALEADYGVTYWSDTNYFEAVIGGKVHKYVYHPNEARLQTVE